jgi:hypothetical protein
MSSPRPEAWSVPTVRTFTSLLGTAAGLALFAATGSTYAEFRTQAFKPTDLVLEAVSGPAADPDADGLANFAEHALGLDPGQPDADRGLRWERQGQELVLDFPVASAPRDARVWVESAAELRAAWTPLAGELRDRGASAARHSVRVTPAPDREVAFLRLNAAEIPPPPATKSWVWFEAEGSGGETSPELSGNAMTWVSPGGAVQRNVTVPAAGEYQLWVRKFWNGQGFRWRVGAGDAWKESRQQTLADLLLLGGNAGRRVGWANVGSVTLQPGAAAFRLEVLAGESGVTAYDCFLLTRDPFTPRGKLKPDEKQVVNQSGWFAFQPDADPFGFSPIDLRHLNERQAGEHGFIRTRGEGFVHEQTGAPARFWAVNVGMGFVGSARSELDVFARAMAKRGVNLVRVHGPVYTTSGVDFGRVDTNRVAQLQYFVHALKREGIYSSLSIYFPLWVGLGPENGAFPGYTGGQHPFALPYFNPAFQQVYREWWRYLLTTPNPHTGFALKDDPAVAFAEMINEDSTLFWTFNPDATTGTNLPEPQRALLERQFGDWLLARYPGLTLAQIKASRWNGVASPQDNFTAGRVGFRGLWSVFTDRNRRDQDTARFLTELMLKFHRETYAYLKQDLGFRGLVYCSNWQTASDKYLDPLDKYANSVADFFDRHGYFGGAHEGPNAAWNLEPGQTYDDRSALQFRKADGTGESFSNPLFDLAYQAQPSVITEVNWPLPNRYRADMILAGAAYAALQGTDAVFWFAAGAPTWDGLPGKFSIQTPVVLGQFPGAALIYRQGLVKTAPRVVDLQLALEDLYALKGTPLPAPQNFDQLRGNDIPPGGTITNASAIDSLAFLVGRAAVEIITNGLPRSQITDLSPFIDRAAKRVRSQTGELEWDWNLGRLTINTPAAQGVTGFLGAFGRVELADVTCESPLEYGSLLVVALDGKPIAQSARLLLQAASEEQPHQWATDKPSGKRTLTNRGTSPLLVREFAGTVTLKRGDAAALTVTPLDFNGYRLPGVPGRADAIGLRRDAAYYLIER